MGSRDFETRGGGVDVAEEERDLVNACLIESILSNPLYHSLLSELLVSDMGIVIIFWDCLQLRRVSSKLGSIGAWDSFYRLWEPCFDWLYAFSAQTPGLLGEFADQTLMSNHTTRLCFGEIKK